MIPMIDIIGLVKSVLMITTMFTVGLLTWVIIGLMVKYIVKCATKGLIWLLEKLLRS